MSEVADLLGRTVAGKFTIEAHVGGGAMGEVYRARHAVLHTPVALKVLRADIAKDPTFRERFEREAKAASKLDHPNSVRVIDFGVEPDGLTYIAMELLSGRDLLALLRQEWPLPDERIVDILSQALGAVSTAHGLGILHRDIKPENIMVTTTTDDDGHVHDRVKVCDFGIAKVSEGRAFSTENDRSLTSSGALVGTPEYMSPEQARGDAIDPRSDVYSAGIVLYQMLTGKLPFTGENILSIALKQVTDVPAPPSKHRPEVNPKLEAICLRALEKDKAKRFASAKEMRADLRAAIGLRAPSSADSSAVLPASAASSPDVQSAPTIKDDRPLFESKETAVGAELPVAPRRDRTLVGIVVVALGVGAAIAVALARPGTAPPGAREVAPASSPLASASRIVPTLLPLTEPTASAIAPAPSDHRPTASAHVPVPVPVPGSAATPAAAKAPTGTAPTGTASTGTVAAAAATGPPPDYNPSGASLGLDTLTTERVKREVVSAKIGEAMPDLTNCYRDALRTAGAPLGGRAEVALSIDDTGRVTAVVNAPNLPGMQRCAQVRLNRITVPTSALDGPGASASQWLKLNP